MPYKDPAQRRAYHRRYMREYRPVKHGLTRDQHDALLEQQGGVCAICKSPPRPNDGGVLHIDHNHTCCPGKRSCGACVRGLLCSPCNRALGLLNDDPERLEAAAAYVRKEG